MPYHAEDTIGVQPCCSSFHPGATPRHLGCSTRSFTGCHKRALPELCWLKTREAKEGIRCEGMKYHCIALVQDVSCNYAQLAALLQVARLIPAPGKFPEATHVYSSAQSGFTSLHRQNVTIPSCDVHSHSSALAVTLPPTVQKENKTPQQMLYSHKTGTPFIRQGCSKDDPVHFEFMEPLCGSWHGFFIPGRAQAPEGNL